MTLVYSVLSARSIRKLCHTLNKLRKFFSVTVKIHSWKQLYCRTLELCTFAWQTIKNLLSTTDKHQKSMV